MMGTADSASPTPLGHHEACGHLPFRAEGIQQGGQRSTHVGSETKAMSQMPPESDISVFPRLVTHHARKSPKTGSRAIREYSFCSGCSVKPEIELIDMSFVT